MNAKKEASPFTHSLTELGDALGVPRALRKHLVSLTADYTMARYPDAANGVPYEVYDRETAEAKVASAEAGLEWVSGQTNGFKNFDEKLSLSSRRRSLRGLGCAFLFAPPWKL